MRSPDVSYRVIAHRRGGSDPFTVRVHTRDLQDVLLFARQFLDRTPEVDHVRVENTATGEAELIYRSVL